jgi:hypothetical protein
MVFLPEFEVAFQQGIKAWFARERDIYKQPQSRRVWRARPENASLSLG